MDKKQLIDFEEKSPNGVFPAYKKAFYRKDGKNTILVEYGDYYNTK